MKSYMMDWIDEPILYQAVKYAHTLYFDKEKSSESACTRAAIRYSISAHQIKHDLDQCIEWSYCIATNRTPPKRKLRDDIEQNWEDQLINKLIELKTTSAMIDNYLKVLNNYKYDLIKLSWYDKEIESYTDTPNLNDVMDLDLDQEDVDTFTICYNYKNVYELTGNEDLNTLVELCNRNLIKVRWYYETTNQYTDAPNIDNVIKTRIDQFEGVYIVLYKYINDRPKLPHYLKYRTLGFTDLIKYYPTILFFNLKSEQYTKRPALKTIESSEYTITSRGRCIVYYTPKAPPKRKTLPAHIVQKYS